MKTPKMQAIEIIETFWVIEPRYMIGTGKPDYSIAKKYAYACTEQIVMSHHPHADYDYWYATQSEIENYKNES